MIKSHREIEESDRNYRRYIKNVAASICANTSVFPVVFAPPATPPVGVTISDDTPQLPTPNHGPNSPAKQSSLPERALTVTPQGTHLDAVAAHEFLQERSAIAEYDGQLSRSSAEAQAQAELDVLQGKQNAAPDGPIPCNAKQHMLTSSGIVTHDPAKCYMWTRETLGYGWWYTSDFPPPQ